MWLPIESAPKDGTKVLVFKKFKTFGDSMVLAAYWVDGEWMGTWDGTEVRGFTHWQPLPEPPQ